LHQIGLNVFSFDYRGYGLSASGHPTQQRMTEDSDAAWLYLTSSRGISPKNIVLYGTGVGTSLVARLAREHPEVPALVLDSPHTDLLNLARSDPRSGLLPVSLLFHENFPLAAQLGSLTTPKLLISLDGAKASPAFALAASPKMTVDLPTGSGPLFTQAVTRFLDQYRTLSH
jgi:pimeloyl-ACP methyl ester carboxylesterase